ncbi:MULTISPECIES: alpha/beta hydrolase [unclassified Rhizobium]|jgi:alpha-beta hydrolase superfamily lysophospholipase|uniref:alpha/beta hydrolase n=1 Tax=unclassified Rhizobium TaxID=2613769 RepID=UPI0006892831|nr:MULTISPECIES: alpha/beta hydrolase [unclassified Rhizobium]RKD35923.1 serine aminopeptidase S33 family [Rhizobium sp. WW_1]
MNPLRSVSLALAMVLHPAFVISTLAEPVSFKTRDGVTIFGDFRRAQGDPRALILLFHMAGSNKSEYSPLAPILNKAGFATLAIDQRSGGNLFGGINETAAGVAGTPSYADTLPDLEAAIAYGCTRTSGPLAAWGSSYSSALVFIAAERHPEVKALLAFSPAEYIKGYSIEKEAARLTIPVFITSSPDSDEVQGGGALARAVPGHKAVQYIPAIGVHGSSTLRVDADPAGAAENWKHVMSFLDGAFPRQ